LIYDLMLVCFVVVGLVESSIIEGCSVASVVFET